MNRLKKWLAVATLLILIVVPSLSYAYILENENHVCTSKHCSICEELQFIRQVLKAFGESFSIAVASILLFHRKAKATLLSRFELFKKATLVNLKVKLVI